MKIANKAIRVHFVQKKQGKNYSSARDSVKVNADHRQANKPLTIATRQSFDGKQNKIVLHRITARGLSPFKR
jgi:hypothetical protein